MPQTVFITFWSNSFFLFAFFAGKALKTKADIHNELI